MNYAGLAGCPSVCESQLQQHLLSSRAFSRGAFDSTIERTTLPAFLSRSSERKRTNAFRSLACSTDGRTHGPSDGELADRYGFSSAQRRQQRRRGAKVVVTLPLSSSLGSGSTSLLSTPLPAVTKAVVRPRPSGVLPSFHSNGNSDANSG